MNNPKKATLLTVKGYRAPVGWIVEVDVDGTVKAALSKEQLGELLKAAANKLTEKADRSGAAGD